MEFLAKSGAKIGLPVLDYLVAPAGERVVISQRATVGNRIPIVVLALLVGFPPTVQAQPTKISRIGFLSVSGSADRRPGPTIEAFRQGLRDIGYQEGKNIFVEYRYAAQAPDRIPGLVTELVQLRVDVIVTSSSAAIRAASLATKTIPIVIIASQDPVASGLVASLSRPGGNITGVTRLSQELSGKRLELLKEALPVPPRVGALGVQGNSLVKEYQSAAHDLRIPLHFLEVPREPNPDFEGIFRAAVKNRINAVIVLGNSLINAHQNRIVQLAIQYKLPSMYQASGWVQAGGLISYTADDGENFRRAAVYVDKILKGAKPGDLPIEQPTKFELTINLRTANQIGLVVPPNVLARADRVIR